MDFPELIDAVVVKTGRPDRVADIELALKEATQWAHLSDFFKRDIVEIPIVYDPAQFNGRLELGRDLPGFRKIAYWRKYDRLTGTVGDYLEETVPDKLFDSFKCKRTDIYYLAGKVLNWLSSTSDNGHMIGYYKFPFLRKETYDSWIAEQFPFILVNFASSIVFNDIGKLDESKKRRGEAEVGLQRLSVNEVEAAAR